MPTPKPYTAADGRTTWRVRFRHRGRESSETFPTKRAAQVFCNDIDGRGVDYAVAMRDRAELDHNAPTLDEVAEKWLTWKAKRVRSDRTVADYRRDYQRHISPALGGRPVTTIEDTDVQQLVESWIGVLAPKTVSDKHAILHGILAWAASTAGDKIIPANPATGTDLPNRKPLPVKALRPGEWQALHAALQQIDPNAADLALFLVSSGWRWSEATALDAWSTDDDGAAVRVTMGRVMRRNAAGQNVLVEDEGKRAASLRSIHLDAAASRMVRRRLEDAGGGLIFTTRRGNPWRYSNFIRDAWDPAVKVANLARRPTPHWLRHTSVVWAAQAGASLPELQSRIGHASIATTINVYGRGITDVQPAVLDRVAALRDGVRPALD